MREKNKQNKCSWTGINMRAVTVGIRAGVVRSTGVRIYSKFVIRFSRYGTNGTVR
jgi:hypothetical protein